MTASNVRGALAAALGIPASTLDLARGLAALSLVAPGASLQMLCDHFAELSVAVAPLDLSNAISTALRSFDGEASVRRTRALEIGRRYRDLLSAQAAVEVLGALGTDLDPAETIVHDAIASRFPAEPHVLRAALGVARARGDDARTNDLLTALGLADRTPGTVAFVHRSRPARATAGARPVRAALLSSYTIDPLVPYLDLACRALGLWPEIYVAPFNSWTRDILDEASGLRAFEPEIAFLAVSIDDLMPELAGHLDPDALEAGGRVALERVVSAARHFTMWAAGRPLVVHSFHSAFAGSLGIADGREGVSRADWLARLNAKLGDEMRALPACYVLDVNDAVVASGASLADNPKVRHLAAMRLPPPALGAVADAYARYVAPLKGLTRKCVVVDLDNTLWGGVVGELGKDGIRLGKSAPGSEFVEFQEFLRSLRERGILLAINSKNNPDDALDVIRSHEAMVLRESDFCATRINWEPKPENMRAIAAELNIGIDSLIFVDDNPLERDQMRALLPEVLTVEMPRDATLYRSVLERLPQLQTLAITADDRVRLERYQTGRLREHAKASTANLTEYLRSLEIAVEIAAATPSDVPRIAQLFAKTNQFNVTTKRYDAADVERIARDRAFGLWTLRSKDRFGDHGLVALALVEKGPQVWTIDSFLMSCRVIGYGIETSLLEFVAERAREGGATALGGRFVATKKNAPARDLFEKHGFASSGTLDSAPGEAVQCWELDLARPLDFPAHVECSRRDA